MISHNFMDVVPFPNISFQYCGWSLQIGDDKVENVSLKPLGILRICQKPKTNPCYRYDRL